MNLSTGNTMILNSDSSYISLCRDSYCIDSLLTHMFDSTKCTVLNSDATMLINCQNCQVINSPHTRLTNCRNVAVINSRFVSLLNQSDQTVTDFRPQADPSTPRRPNRLPRLVWNISDLSGVRRSFENTSECSICRESIERRLGVKLECDHIFHEACITTWINSPRSAAFTCPNCRAPIRRRRHLD